MSPARLPTPSRLSLARDVLLPLIALVALSLAVTGRGRVLARRAPAAVVSRAAAPWVDASYFDRTRIERQSVVPPGMVQTILLPTLGAPARLTPATSVPIVLSTRPAPTWTFELIARDALTAIDGDLYATTPMPMAREALADRVRASREARRAGASTNADHGARLLSETEREALRARERDATFVRGLDDAAAAVAAEDGDAVRRRVARVRAHLREAVEGPARAARRPLRWSGSALKVDGAPAWRVDADAPADLPDGLYALLVFDGAHRLVDAQLNAVFRAPETRSLRFVVAADLQWGELRPVVASVLKFVSLMNGLAPRPGEAATARETSPEFMIVAGDIVDCHFGSSSSASAKVFGGATDYPRDFLQAWLALAALRVPAYVMPGNHDGFRFEGVLSSTTSDGLLLYESTFGPLYARFDRAAFRFVMLNSYDLPPEFRTSRRSTSSSAAESVSGKLNVLNWGGGVQTTQHAWLREQLGLSRGASLDGRVPLVFLHHDPRGSYPSLRRGSDAPDEMWTTARHFPVTAERTDRGEVFSSAPPHFADTQELHAGYYSPLRHPDSPIRSAEWFELGLNPVPPIVRGFPGWLRWQHGWHSNYVYAGHLDSREPFDAAPTVVSPADLMTTLVDGRVRVIFKAHDNRFCRADMAAGESVFGPAAEGDLGRFGSASGRALLERTRLQQPMTVFHVADIADADTDGHGFLWVEADGTELDAFEVDHY